MGLKKTVARRRKTCKRRHIDRKERRERQERLQRQIDGAIAGIVRRVRLRPGGQVGGRVIEQALQNEVTALLGRAKSERRNLGDMTVVDASCNKCGARRRSVFSRGGFYHRGLLTFEAWTRIDVPRIRCQCGGVVDFEFAELVPHQQVWFDVEQRGLELAGICVSLRDAVRVLACPPRRAWRNGQPLSIGTLNRMVNKAANLAEAFRSGELKRVLAVVMLDGVWLATLEPTGEGYVDKLGRHRQPA